MSTKKEIVAVLCKPFAMMPRPFRSLAKKLGMSEEKLLGLLKHYTEEGLIRRIGIILGHREAGFKSNVLVAWKVGGARIEKAGKALSGFHEVSHCYARVPHPEWPYTIYTMVHEKNKKACLAAIGKMAKKAKISSYKMLFTKKEFKKTKADLEGILT